MRLRVKLLLLLLGCGVAALLLFPQHLPGTKHIATLQQLVAHHAYKTSSFFATSAAELYQSNSTASVISPMTLKIYEKEAQTHNIDSGLHVAPKISEHTGNIFK